MLRLLYSIQINSGRDVNDSYCHHECKVKQCQWGCKHYEVGPDSTCQDTCSQGWATQGNSTSKARSLQQEESQYCSDGCIKALQNYARQIRAMLPPLPVPELKNGMKSHSSLVLHWNTPRLSNVTYYVQARMPDTTSTWEITSAHWLDGGDINVTNLRPFVTYKFQILLVITPRDFMTSNESEPIITEPFGAPSEAPKIIEVSSPTPTVISVTWKPPLFTNGQLLGYYLTLTPVSPESKDKKLTLREVGPESTQWTFRQLESGQMYLVNVSATNSVGKGPAGSVNITTPSPEKLSTEDAAFLVLAQDNKVVKQNTELLLNYDPDTVLTLNSSKTVVNGSTVLFQIPGDEVTGIALDIHKQMLYVSDSTNTIYALGLGTPGQSRVIFPELPDPSAITLDWLRNILYVVNKNQILQCDVVTNNCRPASMTLSTVPVDVKVDPLNGYLYFTLGSDKQGLYRIDTGDITSHGPAPHSPVVIDNFMTFTLDFNNILIYFPDESQNSMRSSSLDGREITDIRKSRTQRAMFQNVVSMVYHNDLFYWTNGYNVLQEEYDAIQNTYYHNQLAMFADHFSGLNMLHKSVQPRPAPHSAPQALQALFRTTDVLLSWEPPKRLAYQGRGAWNTWSYDIMLLKPDHRPLQQISNVWNTTITLSNLDPNTLYQVKVRAKSDVGTGPWSALFRGRTLNADALTAQLLMIEPNPFGGGDLVAIDTIGEGRAKLAIIRGKVRDMTWSPRAVYMVTEEGNLLSYRPGYFAAMREDEVPQIVSVAYDWLAGKLYMSLSTNPGMIKRADVSDLSKQEFVTQGLASHMAIDAINGRLYWVTENSVESCLLNGERLVKHFFIPYFSGSKVISLTLNFDLGKLLWYVKSYDKQEIYMTDLIQGEARGEANRYQLIGTVNSIANDSVLQYHFHRIFWQNPEQQIILGDMDVNHTSVVSPARATIFLLRHHSLHPYPEGLTEATLRVIPSEVDPGSISCSGRWNRFRITWAPASVNHGSIFYEVSIQADQDKDVIVKTNQTWYEVEGFSPYSLLEVRVTGYTYWGYGKSSTARLHSPMSVPSKPLTPRVFVTQSKASLGSETCTGALFRWASPEVSNGVIDQYVVKFWDTSSNQLIKKALSHTARHFSLDNCLAQNVTYSFQVQACTKVGCSEMTEVKTATAKDLNPVPRVLLATGNNIQVMDVDNTHNIHTVVTGTSPLAVTYLQVSQDQRVFWVDYNGQLWENSSKGRKKLLDLDVSVTDMTIDWISRTVYIASVQKLNGTSIILSYQLDEGQQEVQVMRSGVEITSLVREPYSSTLFWTERPVDGSHSTLYHCPDDGVPSPTFSSRHLRSATAPCNCSVSVVGSVLALDHTRGTELEVLLYDEVKRAIVATDREGCHCREIVSSAQGFPPDLISVDHLLIYWYHRSENQLYSLDKGTGKLTQIAVPSIQSLEAYGSHLQPLPSDDCLNPEAYNGTLTMVRSSNVSLAVLLDSVSWPSSCSGISHPATKYIVYYRQTHRQEDRCQTTGQDCQKVESYSNEVTLTDLDPYTSYTIQGAASNYYTEYLSEALSRPFYFRTQVGVPSPPTNVNVTVDTPITVKVFWSPPVNPNGPAEQLRYMVKYSTQINNLHQVFNKTVKVVADSDRMYHYNLTNLQPGHTYQIRVLAGNLHGIFSDESQVLQVKTYENPGPIVLLNATHDWLSVSWTPPPDNSSHLHLFYYGKVVNKKVDMWTQSDTYLGMPDRTEVSKVYVKNFTHLEPNTDYAIRVKLAYRLSRNAQFFWPTNDLKFTYRTKAYVPGVPSVPQIDKLTSGYQVEWQPPRDNGQPILNYTLQFCGSESCLIVYEGNASHWVVDTSKVPQSQDVYFQVAATNSLGQGPFSANSTIFNYIDEVAAVDNMTVIAVILSIVFVIVLGAFVVVYFCIRRQQQLKQKPIHFTAVSRGPDMELATLRDLPAHTVQQNNALYTVNMIPTDSDIAALPHFRRDQLMLTKFLGSGAFGEVFEGVAKNILDDNSGKTKVAVKTLRKSASDQEKEEFLKEALLMSNFKHDHILGLLGVCLDNDPQFIILELMEGGDLLSFLRGNRPSAMNSVYLSLADLMKICVHVARGCSYLEEMHFVHRDLAARNCLVSSKNPREMVVKIGDFGLARDIYKNDYYRKEGEGLLPVRWMSPESLVDGVFTTQSDIWAFGVLSWEVLTFGQQPYQARTNIEVLHFVRSGGQLEQPENCPQDIFELMRKCWCTSPEDRPSFSTILKQLEEFHKNCAVLLTDYIVPVRNRSPNPEVGRWRDSYLYGHFAPPNLSFSSYIHPGKGFLGEQLSAYLRRQQLRPDHALCPGMDVVHEYLDVVDVVEDRGSGMYNTDYPVFNIEKAPTETQIATVGVVEGKSTHRPLTRSHGMTVPGYDPASPAKRRKRPDLKISLPSPEGYDETSGLYRKIHRATSFDSPDPQETEVDEEMLHYLNPRLHGAPSYLQLISDPNDPPPSAVHSKSRLSSHNSHHASLNSRHNSQSSQSYYRKYRSESQSSRHSSASTDIYSSPVGSNLNLDLPSNNGGKNCEYEQIHSVESFSGKYAPYMMTSPSIPEDDDDAFPEGYDYVDYPHRKLPKTAAYSVIRGTLQCLRNGYSEPSYSAMDVISNNNLNLLNNNLPSMQGVDNIPGGRTTGQGYPVDNAMFDYNDLIQASLV
uniref:Tyrosine-protein kinase receptor n=1 Tax=Crassostrea virginica TaxID=6565 RepID=A0A8B8ANZ5_CRAVI|nr:proto-oncogene tyrosine-protein kinase ROS-like isoform X1 [Crassostrea virginica]